MRRFPAVTVLLALTGGALAQEPDFPSEPLGAIVQEERQTIRPGIEYIRRVTDDPMRLHALVIDATRPEVSFQVALGGGEVIGRAPVREIARREGALLAINGDYWTHGGVPLNLTVIDSEIVIAPKHRTAFAIMEDGTPEIGMWSDAWSWTAEVEAPGGERAPIVMMNSDCGEGWLCLYTHRWGKPSRGNSVSPVVEALLDDQGTVLEIRRDQPGIDIPEDRQVLTGRDDKGEWLAEHLAVGERARLHLTASEPLEPIRHAIGAGPRILADGKFVQDPVALFPGGEEFTLDWKESHYLERHPRSAVGVSRDRGRVILLTVDGRQPQWSIGIHQRQMAELLVEFGAWDGMDLDSGGSATMVINGEVVNSPSDEAGAAGGDGVERPVANALLVHYRD